MENKEKTNNYEVLFLTKKNDQESIKDLAKEIKKIEGVIDLEVSVWKETKPAYRVKDISEDEEAIYSLAKIECKKNVLNLVDSSFKANKIIRRYRILNMSRDSKKMKVGKIQNPKPRIRRRPANFSRERFDYKQKEKDQQTRKIHNAYSSGQEQER